MDLLREKGPSRALMDIAAGHGRYVLEAIEKTDHCGPTPCCCETTVRLTWKADSG